MQLRKPAAVWAPNAVTLERDPRAGRGEGAATSWKNRAEARHGLPDELMPPARLGPRNARRPSPASIACPVRLRRAYGVAQHGAARIRAGRLLAGAQDLDARAEHHRAVGARGQAVGNGDV